MQVKNFYFVYVAVIVSPNKSPLKTLLQARRLNSVGYEGEGGAPVSLSPSPVSSLYLLAYFYMHSTAFRPLPRVRNSK